MSDIAAFTMEGWNRVADDKKRFWATVHIAPNSPLLTSATRPYTTENTRAQTLWAHYRDTLASRTPEAGRLLVELRETDRQGSENPNEVRALMTIHHRDAAQALNATGLEMRLRDAAERGDLDPADVPKWLAGDDITADPADPRAGQITPGLRLERPRGYAVILTGKNATEAEARVIAATLRWARNQDPIGRLDPEKVRADFDAMKPVPQYDRVGPSVGLVASRFYENGQVVRDVFTNIDRDLPIVVTGKIADHENRLLPTFKALAQETGRTIITTRVTPSADKNLPHDIKAISDLGHETFLKPQDYKGALVILNADGEKFMSTQLMIHHKLVDMASTVATFDDGKGDYGVRQAHSLAIGAGKLAASFDRQGKLNDLAAIDQQDRRYLRTAADLAENRIPRDLPLSGTEGILFLSQIPGMQQGHIEALQSRFDTIGAMRAVDYRSLPVPADLRETLRSANTYSAAAERSATQVARASAAGVSIVTFADDRYPRALLGMPGGIPPVIFMKGEMPQLAGSVAILGTQLNMGEQRRLDPEAIETQARSGGARLPNGIRLKEASIDGDSRIEAILPEIGHVTHRATLKALGIEPVVVDKGERFLLPADAAPIIEKLLPADQMQPQDGLSSEGKVRSALLAVELSRNETTVVAPLVPGASHFAIEGAATGQGRVLAIAAGALDHIQSTELRQTIAAVEKSGGAVISTTPLGSPDDNRVRAIQLATELADAIVLTEARRGDLSMLAVEEAHRQNKPLMALTPDAQHTGPGVNGNLAILSSAGHDIVTMPSRVLLTNTTMWGADEKTALGTETVAPPPKPKSAAAALEAANADKALTVERTESGELIGRLERAQQIASSAPGLADPLPKGKSVAELDASLRERRVPDAELSPEDLEKRRNAQIQHPVDRNTPARRGYVGGSERSEGVGDATIATGGHVTRSVAWDKPAIPIRYDQLFVGAPVVREIAAKRMTAADVQPWVSNVKPRQDKAPAEPTRFQREAMNDHRAIARSVLEQNDLSR